MCPVAPEATCNMWLGALERPVSAPLTFGHPTEPMEGPRQRRIKLLGGMQDDSFPNTGSLICPPDKSIISQPLWPSNILLIATSLSVFDIPLEDDDPPMGAEGGC